MSLLYFLDLTGTFVFAISGAIAASNKRFDIFGSIVIAFVTSVGGGTIRDVLIGYQPVGWMRDLNYLYLIGLAVVVSYFFKPYVLKLRKTLFLFDSIGIGLFTILGLQKTLNAGLDPLVAIMMGTVSAVFGGVVRDILCNEIPLIFRKEIYATACVLGGVLYWLFIQIYDETFWSTVLTVLLIIGLRVLAVKKQWSLPIVK